ncbi:DUF4145 domain-containing protein [Chromobacterium violaceum]|uniref:DUF4145 domain-containing protein n=1 Tax=Chromobacterium violaceum TaxID=536 RepID=A0AAX2M8S5_CHRVL|nr:DUF4145 domain-containing protein [Chromobacterium violaceum]OLZ77944.1 hypothetical protein BS642_13880 [Chromobacterium violaceum]STB70141.1 Uncharacterised protein [Chromobacterium violaceum]STB70553.1 Uncharacterised protein [Chromobacterium violaceum]SUX32680.1 Uncharacterised protein [Chromobacterium violaceum]SUX34785.1 Uncharacterised protein [Chromobacterium violaceum]
MTYEAPDFTKDAFTCPHCNVYAHMRWSLLRPTLDLPELALFQASCQRCDDSSLWLCQNQGNELVTIIFAHREGKAAPPHGRAVRIFPTDCQAPMPNSDLPDDCLEDYMEARSIAELSPRGAAALLRLVIQKLCKHFGEPGKDINSDIGSLVQKGLPKKLQEALDVVRVVGNEAVHPGEIDFQDDAEVVFVLFSLINLIVEKMITEPKEYAAIYQSLPAKKIAGIEQRDKPKT